MSKVGYVHSDYYVKLCDFIPHDKLKGRSACVHNLIQSFGMFEKMVKIIPYTATEDDLFSFHSKDYIEALRDHVKLHLQNENLANRTLDEYNLGYDCPVETLTYKFASTVCGGSIKAARALNQNLVRTCINWNGGWHHAKRSEASGFCYFNDVVLAILELLKQYNRVLYIDIDAHHGDGVEFAFENSRRVMTLSVHRYSSGFFPGTGSLQDVGFGKGKYFSVNVPLLRGITDNQFSRITISTIEQAISYFHPSAIVLQCGADCLVGDPIAEGFNLTLEGPLKVVRHVISYDLPLLLLGGGGYEKTNAARLWTSITGVALGMVELDDDIPDSVPEFLDYGPGFGLDLQPSVMKNHHTEEYEDKLLKTVRDNIQNIVIEST